MNEKLYREALELIYRHIECYGRAIHPSVEDMRYSWQLIQDLAQTALKQGKTKTRQK